MNTREEEGKMIWARISYPYTAQFGQACSCPNTVCYWLTKQYINDPNNAPIPWNKRSCRLPEPYRSKRGAGLLSNSRNINSQNRRKELRGSVKTGTSYESQRSRDRKHTCGISLSAQGNKGDETNDMDKNLLETHCGENTRVNTQGSVGKKISRNRSWKT